MTRTRIKICGICRPQDAAAAADAGADAIGVIFHPASPRFVSIDLAREIVAAVPPFVTTVGLFVDAGPSVIRQTLKEVPFSAIQLHGNESPEYVADLKPIRVLKGIRIRDESTLAFWKAAIAEHHLDNIVGMLLETPHVKTGGSGIPNDWNAISALQASGSFAGLPPAIVAGGLNPQNVAGVIRQIRPYAVDLSTGVESSPREKSVEKLQAFVRAVRSAET